MPYKMPEIFVCIKSNIQLNSKGLEVCADFKEAAKI